MILLVWKKKLKFISWKKTDSRSKSATSQSEVPLWPGAWGKWCKILHSGSLLALRLKARKHYIYIMNLRKKLSVDKRHPLLKYTESSYLKKLAMWPKNNFRLLLCLFLSDMIKLPTCYKVRIFWSFWIRLNLYIHSLFFIH